jgi:hypothetical protein
MDIRVAQLTHPLHPYPPRPRDSRYVDVDVRISHAKHVFLIALGLIPLGDLQVLHFETRQYLQYISHLLGQL